MNRVRPPLFFYSADHGSNAVTGKSLCTELDTGGGQGEPRGRREGRAAGASEDEGMAFFLIGYCTMMKGGVHIAAALAWGR